jgi:hypothetical protein
MIIKGTVKEDTNTDIPKGTPEVRMPNDMFEASMITKTYVEIPKIKMKKLKEFKKVKPLGPGEDGYDWKKAREGL